MAGIDHDFFGAAPAAPGDGRQRELGRILDRDDNIYGNNVYLYLTDNSRVDLRTIIENPPGGGPTVVTAPNPLPNNEIILGAGSQTIKTSGITFPSGSPSAGQIITATDATHLQWTTPSAAVVTTVNSGGGAGDSLVINPGPGAATLKDILAGTGIAVVSNATDVRIDNAGVTSIANTGTGTASLVVGGPTGAVTVKRITGSGGTVITSDANQVFISAAGITGTGTDNHITRWDGTTAVQDSSVVLDDSANITGVNSINMTNAGTLTATTDDFVAGSRLTAGSTINLTTSVANVVAGADLSSSSTITSNQDGNLLLGLQLSNAAVTLASDYNTLIGCTASGCTIQTSGETSDACFLGGVTAQAGITMSATREVMIGSSNSTSTLTLGGTGLNGVYSTSMNTTGASNLAGSCTAIIASSCSSGAVSTGNTGQLIGGFFGNSATATSMGGAGQAILGCSGYAATGTSAANVVAACTNGETGNFSQCMVVASTSTKGGKALTICGGTGAGTAATTNRKWMIDSSDGGYYSNKTAGTYGTLGAAFDASGFDYAEKYAHIEEGEIPSGMILVEDGGKITLADASKGHTMDEVIGVRSLSPAYSTGNSFSHWSGRFVKDKWGLVVNDEVSAEEAERVKDTEPMVYLTRKRPRENPVYDPSRDYEPRTKRPREWSDVGMLGQLLTRVDETVTKNRQYVTISNRPGIGTLSETKTKLRVEYISSPYDAKDGYGIAMCRLNC